MLAFFYLQRKILKVTDTLVKKRSGSEEIFNPEKINKVIDWACDGIENVSASSIAINAKISIVNKMETTHLHDLLIESAANMISEEQPEYSKVAARLLNYKLRKEVWGGFNAPRLFDHIQMMVDNDLYDEAILDTYTKDEINKINEFLHHDRDDIFEYAGLKQLCDKYIMKNVKDGRMFETPQFIYILIAMTLFGNYPQSKRMVYVKRAYSYFSRHKINLPTPIMAGIRSNKRSGASCCLIEVDDDLRSISTTAQAAMLATSDKYGMGIDMSKVRSIGASVRNGETKHTGVIPFLRVMEGSIKSCMQGAARRGSGTVTFTIFHPEIIDILKLKDNSAVEEKRVAHLDYLICNSKLFWQRYLNDEYITLMDFHDAPEVYNNFGLDGFDEIYEKMEKRKFPSKKRVKASEIFNTLIKQRQETGRIYILNIDHANKYSPWSGHVTMSNLCVSGDQRVPTQFGLLTARELAEIGDPLQVFDNKGVKNATKMSLIEEDVPTYRITLENGMSHTVTDYHKVLTSSKSSTREKFSTISCNELSIGDRVAIQTNKGLFGNLEMCDEAFLLGLYQSDGTQTEKSIMIDVWEHDFDLIDEIEERFSNVHYKYNCDVSNGNGRHIEAAKFHDAQTGHSDVKKKRLSSRTLRKSLDFKKGFVPDWIWKSNEETHWSYLRGLLYTDGSATLSDAKGCPIQVSYTDTSNEFLKDLQLLYANLGLQGAIHVAREAGFYDLPDGLGGYKKYFCKKTYRLIVGNKNDCLDIEKNTGFLTRKGVLLEDRKYRDNSKKLYKIESIEEAGSQNVYCCTVDSDEHLFVCNGFITHNCVEILQEISPIYNINDTDGEIGVCCLAATNMLTLASDQEHEKACDVIVRLLDELIDYQDYFAPSARKFATEKRSLGVGVINYAAWLARQNLKYSDQQAPNVTSQFFEKQQYYLMKASVQLAKEKGSCKYSDDSMYTTGLLPDSHYKDDIDDFVTHKPSCDWDGLRKDLSLHGIRNATVSAIMPSEASSKISGATNGIEPPRSPIVYMKSKGSTLPCLIPNIKNKEKYTYAFDMGGNDGYIRCAAAIQRWICMGMSTNFYYRAADYPDRQIPREDIISDHLMAYKYGIKSHYYLNTDDGDVQFESGCAGGACSI